MPKNKLKRIKALPDFDNVIDDPFHYKGKWDSLFFKNNNSITVELGCGKGECVIELAQKFPKQNFIGIDLKGARLFIAATRCKELQLENVCFIHTNIENILDIFAPAEVANIWIPFPDPYPKSARAQKRLTSSRFIKLYRNVLISGGKIHFKTDDEKLYQFTLDTIELEKCTLLKACDNLNSLTELDDFIKIQTTFEKRHRAAGKPIKYIEFLL
jgi:tRNA (guanine-N7-)-methyltransferase